MAQKKVYDNEFKIQAVNLGREIGLSKAAKELCINIDALYGWNKRAKDARKSDDLFRRDFTAERPFEKCVTDITEIPARDGKLYVSAIFDGYDLCLLGLAMADNMKADLCVSTIDYAYKAFPSIRGAVIHSDRGSQYTSTPDRSTGQRLTAVDLYRA